MKRMLLAIAFLSLLTRTAIALGDDPCLIIVSQTDGSTERGWSAQLPTGSSDFLNVRYDIPVERGPNQPLIKPACTNKLAGINVAVADFQTNQFKTILWWLS